MQKISKNMTLDTLITDYPKSVRFLMEKGIKCLACGEPIWGTLESNAKEKGLTDKEINQLVSELEALVEKRTKL